MKYVFLFLSVFAFGCDDIIRQEHEESRRRELAWVVQEIRYIKDPRTNLCFAYYWGGAGNGGPALAYAPCEAVPPELLKH